MFPSPPLETSAYNCRANGVAGLGLQQG